MPWGSQNRKKKKTVEKPSHKELDILCLINLRNKAVHEDRYTFMETEANDRERPEAGLRHKNVIEPQMCF